MRDRTQKCLDTRAVRWLIISYGEQLVAAWVRGRIGTSPKAVELSRSDNVVDL
jgi:hypothetical protein